MCDSHRSILYCIHLAPFPYGVLAVQGLYKNRNAFGTMLKVATTIAIWWSCLEVIATVCACVIVSDL